jgi:ubiquinol-cytochrome c reductase iron-sulfur subunit
MADQDLDRRKRRFLLATTTVASGVAAGAAGVPFVASMLPSERARAAGAPVEVDITALEPGQMMVVEWRGKPVWILHRTPQMLKAVQSDDGRVADPQSRRSEQPDYARNQFRSLKPEYLVVVGICTHLGCSPVQRSRRRPSPSPPTGAAASTAPATARCSISPGASTRTSPRPTT